MKIINKQIGIFVSYARVNRPVCERIVAALAPLETSESIKLWYDVNLDSGAEYFDEITDRIRKSEIVLALVSNAFLASKACASEMRQAKAYSEANEKQIIPVVLEICDWKNSGLERYQALPTGGIPLDSNPEQGLVSIVAGVEALAQKLSAPQCSSEFDLFSSKDLVEMLDSVEQAIATIRRVTMGQVSPPVQLLLDLAELENKRVKLKTELTVRAGRF